MRLTNALDAAGIGVWHLDRRSGMVSWNGGLGAMLGIPAERQEADLETVLRRIPEEDRERVRIRLQATMLTGSCDVEHRFYHSDGSIRWVRTTGSTARTTDGDHCFTGIVVDLTAGKMAEEELRKSEETLRLVQVAADIGSFVAGSDGVGICSAELYRQLGLDPNTPALPVAEMLALIHPDDRAAFRARVSNALSGGGSPRMEFRIIRRDTGEIRWLSTLSQVFRDPDGQGVRFIGAHIDITDQKRVEEELRQSRERLSTIFSQAIVGILHREFTGKVLMVNQRFCELIGRTADDLAAMTADGYTHPDDRAATMALFRENWTTGKPFVMEKRYSRPDGSFVWCEAHVSFVRSPEGDPVSAVVVAHDITERRLSQQEKEQSQRMLELALDAAAAGTWEMDLAAWTMTLSRRCLEIYGLPPDHPAKVSIEEWLDFVDPEGVTKIADLDLSVTQAWEGPAVTATGEVRWLRSFGRVVTDLEGGHTRIVGLQFDDTERHMAGEALRQSEERLRMVQQAAQIGSYEVFADRRSAFSPEFCANLGLPSDSHPDYDLLLGMVHPEDRDAVEQSRVAHHESDGFESVYRVVRADNGEVRWVLNRTTIYRKPDGSFERLVGALLDITDRKTAELALHDSRALSHGIVEATTDCIALLDLDGTLFFMNHSGLRAFEIDGLAVVVGRPWADIWGEAERTEIERALAAARAGEIGRFNALTPTVRGTAKWWDVVVTPVPDEQGRPKQILTIARDVTEHRDAIEQMRWTANHDVLTSLPNRGMFQERLNAIVSRRGGRKHLTGLLLFDLDRFKEVNDTLGHAAGDALLQGFGARLREAVRGRDVVARLGGDEFAIMLADIQGEQDVRDFVARLLAKLGEPLIYEGREIECRASIGAALFPRDGSDAAELLKSADLALYSSKEGSRGEFVMFAPALRTELKSRATMIQIARSALVEDRMLPFYQPQVRLDRGTIAGFEALLRWRDHSGVFHPPAAIAAALEYAETAWPIGQRMHRKIVADMRTWLAADVDFGHVAINASASEFRHDDFAETLLAELDAAAVPCRFVEIEVTESVFMGSHAGKVARALRLLNRHGVRIALDDFGTGFSSLSHLKEFPVDVIKIDRSFVGNVESDKELAIVRAVLNLGRSLNIAVVAEGIETETQATFLRRQGCKLGQGHLYGWPSPADAVPEWIQARGIYIGSSGPL